MAIGSSGSEGGSGEPQRFSERYGQLRTYRTNVARERPDEVSEYVVQCVWYDQLLREEGLCCDNGRAIRVVSPGWWNRGEGPDFKGAQIEFAGRLRTGDVEIHLNHEGWRQHGHHMDWRYDEVMLHVVLDNAPAAVSPMTSTGTTVPTLLLLDFLEDDIREIADRLIMDEYPYNVQATHGHCAALTEAHGSEHLRRLAHLAGEWRMLFKARALRERMERFGANQAVYEDFLSACGFSRFKHHLRAIARQLHYDRVRQLGQEDGLLLEAALLQMAGLLPKALPEGTTAVPHYGRLRGLRRDRLEGLRPLPLEWKRGGVRPNNNPERRLAGAARFLARTAATGLVETLEDIWAQDLTPIERRREFESLFPKPMGFWSTHCTWAGKQMARPSAPLGAGRVRSIIGNVFVPAALAMARERKDRRREEEVFEFFSALPREPENKIQKIMMPRVFGNSKGPPPDFRMQQGLLQLYQDWCESNPSCQNCRVVAYLDIDSDEATAEVKANR